LLLPRDRQWPLHGQHQDWHGRLMHDALRHAAQRPAHQAGASMRAEDDGIGPAGLNSIKNHLCRIADKRHFFMPRTCPVKPLGHLSQIGIRLLNDISQNRCFRVERGRELSCRLEGRLYNTRQNHNTVQYMSQRRSHHQGSLRLLRTIQRDQNPREHPRHLDQRLLEDDDEMRDLGCIRRWAMGEGSIFYALAAGRALSSAARQSRREMVFAFFVDQQVRATQGVGFSREKTRVREPFLKAQLVANDFGFIIRAA
jgi:hypothetical protein